MSVYIDSPHNGWPVERIEQADAAPRPIGEVLPLVLARYGIYEAENRSFDTGTDPVARDLSLRIACHAERGAGRELAGNCHRVA